MAAAGRVRAGAAARRDGRAGPADDAADLDERPPAGGLADDTEGRLQVFRENVVPWLDAVLPLDGAEILEIGCGRGSSTVALAEQGARVTGIDILPERIEVARTRCEVYGTAAEFHVVDAVGVDDLFGDRDFDLVIFFAALEHMTLDERLAAMAAAWRMLRPGRCWCVIDTPNRLWVYDGHTAHLPFFHWLPDELALRYIRNSPRPELAEFGADPGGRSVVELARHGRGVSYHEFELAMAHPGELDVVDTLSSYRSRTSPAWRLLRQANPARRVERLLRRTGPAMHPGFFEESLDLVIRKGTDAG